MGKSEVRAFWDEQAKRFGTLWRATTNDPNLRLLEIEALLKHLPEVGKLLDLGCGNGLVALHVARLKKVEITGIDFSERMIGYAEELRHHMTLERELNGSVSFEVGDMSKTDFRPNSFDAAYSIRSVINLVSLDEQLKALEEIVRILKPGGSYIMIEQTQAERDKINQVREFLGIPKIVTPDHNLYIDEPRFLDRLPRNVRLRNVTNFSSTYYFGSKIINALLNNAIGREPRYDDALNRIFEALPSIGNWGYMKLFLFRKVD